jgi:hypothetical protein
VIVRAAVLVVSATDLAVRVTTAGAGTLPGAVYVMGVPDALDVVDSVPQVEPEHPAPVSVHVTPLFWESLLTVAVTVVVLVVCTETVDLFKVTAIATAVAVTVTCAEALLLVSATDVAVSVTTAGAGTLGGAVYVIVAPDALEVADSVPQAAPVQPVPLNAHVTPLFWESLSTVAVKLLVFVVCTETVDLSSVTAIAAAVAVIVTCAEALLVLCACETAVTVTVAGEGTVAGAVYIPAASIVPCVESPPATPFTCHVTAVFDVFATFAANGLLVLT